MVALPTSDEIIRASERVRGTAIRSPLLSVAGDAAQEARLLLKLEMLQPTRSFKIRGAANLILRALQEQPDIGSITTVSAGNMGLAARHISALRGLPTEIVVPESAPAAKAVRLERLGARVERVPFVEWWARIEHPPTGTPHELFVHPFLDTDVMAGNATIGLELVDELGPEGFDAVYVPFGGGGLAAGIASALRAAGSPAKVYGVEVSTAAPLRAAFGAGESTKVEHRASFVDGIGSSFVLPEMFALVADLLAGSVVIDITEVEAALAWAVSRLGLVPEGASAAAIGAAQAASRNGDRAVAIVSGGNIDTSVVREVLARES